MAEEAKGAGGLPLLSPGSDVHGGADSHLSETLSGGCYSWETFSYKMAEAMSLGASIRRSFERALELENDAHTYSGLLTGVATRAGATEGDLPKAVSWLAANSVMVSEVAEAFGEDAEQFTKLEPPPPLIDLLTVEFAGMEFRSKNLVGDLRKIARVVGRRSIYQHPRVSIPASAPQATLSLRNLAGAVRRADSIFRSIERVTGWETLSLRAVLSRLSGEGAYDLLSTVVPSEHRGVLFERHVHGMGVLSLLSQQYGQGRAAATLASAAAAAFPGSSPFGEVVCGQINALRSSLLALEAGHWSKNHHGRLPPCSADETLRCPDRDMPLGPITVVRIQRWEHTHSGRAGPFFWLYEEDGHGVWRWSPDRWSWCGALSGPAPGGMMVQSGELLSENWVKVLAFFDAFSPEGGMLPPGFEQVIDALDACYGTYVSAPLNESRLIKTRESLQQGVSLGGSGTGGDDLGIGPSMTFRARASRDRGSVVTPSVLSSMTWGEGAVSLQQVIGVLKNKWESGDIVEVKKQDFERPPLVASYLYSCSGLENAASGVASLTTASKYMHGSGEFGCYLSFPSEAEVFYSVSNATSRIGVIESLQITSGSSWVGLATLPQVLEAVGLNYSEALAPAIVQAVDRLCDGEGQVYSTELCETMVRELGGTALSVSGLSQKLFSLLRDPVLSAGAVRECISALYVGGAQAVAGREDFSCYWEATRKSQLLPRSTGRAKVKFDEGVPLHGCIGYDEGPTVEIRAKRGKLVCLGGTAFAAEVPFRIQETAKLVHVVYADGEACGGIPTHLMGFLAGGRSWLKRVDICLCRLSKGAARRGSCPEAPSRKDGGYCRLERELLCRVRRMLWLPQILHNKINQRDTQSLPLVDRA